MPVAWSHCPGALAVVASKSATAKASACPFRAVLQTRQPKGKFINRREGVVRLEEGARAQEPGRCPLECLRLRAPVCPAAGHGRVRCRRFHLLPRRPWVG